MGELMKLEPGMLIKTNYSGPYRIKSIKRGCRCKLYSDTMKGIDREQPPHIHLTLTRPDGTGRFWMGHFYEGTLLSLNKTICGCKKELDYDRIIIMDQDRPIQQSLF